MARIRRVHPCDAGTCAGCDPASGVADTIVLWRTVMAEQDFELYLSLLSRFLRLKSAQRQEIADELRDHLEERLDELTARGLSHEAAIRAALEEFGDAAELANHFTQVSRTRKRRMIMRLTFGTTAALAASLLVATAFWPEGRNVVAPGRAIAQGFGGGGPAVGD